MAEFRGVGPNHNYFGDRPMPISAPLKYERERLSTEMTMDEREWREKWCRDQELAPDEPKYIPEMDEVMMNPVQRLYKKPLNWFFLDKLEPVIGTHASYIARQLIPKSILMYMTAVGLWYIFKYRESNFRMSGDQKLATVLLATCEIKRPFAKNVMICAITENDWGCTLNCGFERGLGAKERLVTQMGQARNVSGRSRLAQSDQGSTPDACIEGILRKKSVSGFEDGRHKYANFTWIEKTRYASVIVVLMCLIHIPFISV